MSRISVSSKVRLYLICDLIESPRRSSESAEASVLIPLPKGGGTRSYFARAVAASLPERNCQQPYGCYLIADEPGRHDQAADCEIHDDKCFSNPLLRSYHASPAKSLSRPEPTMMADMIKKGAAL